MNAAELKRAVLDHSGTFLCSRIHQKSETKLVSWKHRVTAPTDSERVPNIGKLREFYGSFGSIVFYVDDRSGDAARYIAPVGAWAQLHAAFTDWTRDLGEDEREDYLPDWVDSCLVIGEEPQTGNYILVPTVGEDVGAIYHFEHDGFEFNRHANDLLQYVQKLLDLSNRDLAYVATHMRFVEGVDHTVQWWIEELRDNRGNVARTEV